MYVPDTWVLLKFNSDEYGTVYKVLAGWYGSYTSGDAYKINSGITSYNSSDNAAIFKGHSGSEYLCALDREGFSNYTSMIYLDTSIRMRAKKGVSVEVVRFEDVKDELVLDKSLKP